MAAWHCQHVMGASSLSGIDRHRTTVDEHGGDALNAKALTTPAGAPGVGVDELETGTSERIDEIDLGTHEVEKALGIDKERYPMAIQFTVALIWLLRKLQEIRKARASTTSNAHPQTVGLRRPLLDEASDLLRSVFSQADHGASVPLWSSVMPLFSL